MQRGVLLDHRLAHPGGTVDRLRLHDQEVPAIHPGAGEENHERHVAARVRGQGAQGSSFAVTQQTDPARIHFGTHLQPGHRGHGIAAEVQHRRGSEISRGLTDPPVVVPQDHDPPARQVVREHEERPVSEHRLVAVLGTRARDQHDRGVGTVAGRNGECAREPVSGLRVVKPDLHHLVGEGGLRLLWPPRGQGLCVAALEVQWETAPSLGPLPVDRPPVGRNLPRVLTAQGREGEHDGTRIFGHGGQAEAEGALIGTVHRSRQLSGIRALDVKHQAKLRARHAQRPDPVARHHVARGRLLSARDAGTRETERREKSRYPCHGSP